MTIKSRIRNHYFPLISLILAAGLLLYFTRKSADFISYFTDITGYISIFLLAVSLTMGTINMLLKHPNPLSSYLRRDLSLIAGSVALAHSLVGLFVHMRGRPWLYFLKETAHGLSIRFDQFGLANFTGLFSALIIVLLIFTSNDYSITKYGPSVWKNIQRFSYLMFAFAIIHIICYRAGSKNSGLLYFGYIPLFIVVFIIQLVGIRLKQIRNSK